MPTNPGPPSGSAHAATAPQWVCVGLIAAGSVLGGIALIEWVWPVFWVAVGVMAVASAAAARLGIMEAVSEWRPPDKS